MGLAFFLFEWPKDTRQYPYEVTRHIYFVMPDTLGPFVKKHLLRKDYSDSNFYIAVDSTYYVLWDSSSTLYTNISQVKNRSGNLFVDVYGKAAQTAFIDSVYFNQHHK